jgi:hypothetical protein
LDVPESVRQLEDETTDSPSAAAVQAVAVELIAMLVAVTDQDPRILTIREGRALPSGAFQSMHRSLQAGLRAWVEQQTQHPIGYIEQLYTFADRDRTEEGRRVVSISYLGLTREAPSSDRGAARWRGWYGYFPWEDHRSGIPRLIDEQIAPRLRDWANSARTPAQRRSRQQRSDVTFGLNRQPWNEELVLQRYELLHETGLVAEVHRSDVASGFVLPGDAMLHDHRRILATGMARLRAKIKYHPVVFELMPPSFTLLQLQRAVEAIAGRRLHKQNFRRLIEQQKLVEETGDRTHETGGRPAKLFRFRREVLVERAVVGTKLPLARA